MQGEGQLNARAADYRYRVEASAQRVHEAGVQLASRAIVAANHDWFQGARAFVYVRAALEHDRFKDIAQRASVGAGGGVRVLDTARTELSLRTGFDVVSQHRIEAVDERYPALGWSVEWSHWAIAARLQLFHNHEGLWNLRRSEALSLRSRSGLRVPITAGYTLNAQLNIEWERTAAPGRKPTDMSALIGAGFEW